MDDERFGFAFDGRFRPLLAAMGVVPATTYVRLGEAGGLLARFGPWTCRSDLANVVEVSVTGPYRW